MTGERQEVRATGEGILRWAALCLLAAGFTAGCVVMSERQGRLVSVPNYDDAVYFLSATRLIEAGRAEGWNGVRAELRENGLHSPWAVGGAVAAFLAVGYSDWAPYAFNGFVVLGYLMGVGWMLRGLRWWEWGSGVAFFLALPFATLAVVEFRPDLAWAVVLGFGVIFGLVVPGYLTGWGPRVVHAGLCALALWVKPSTFAMTLIVFGYSVAGRILCEAVRARRVPWGEFWRTAGIWAVVVVGLVLPYAVPFGADTWSYFWTNSFGANEEIWRAPGTAFDKWVYYGAGFGAANNLGWAGILLVGVLVTAAFMGGRMEALRWMLIGGLVVVTYGLSSGFGMKSPFLGGAFYGVVIFAGAFAWSCVFGGGADGGGECVAIWWRLAGPLVAVLALGMWSWPPYAWAQAGESGQNFAEVERQVVAILAEAELEEDVRLLFSQSGPLMRENVEMWLVRRGHRTASVKGGFLPSLERFEARRRRADLVFVQDPGMRDAFANLPVEGYSAELVESMRGAEEFQLLGEAVGADAGRVYVYQRRDGAR